MRWRIRWPQALLCGVGRLFIMWGNASLRRELADSRVSEREMAEQIATMEMKLRAADDRERFLASVIVAHEKRVKALQSLLARQIATGKM